MTPPWSDLVATRLFYGRDCAVTISTLAEQLNVSRRQVEKAIEELRASGSPIVTGSSGIWLTTSPDELRAAYRSLRRRYISQAVNARVLLRTARRFEKYVQAELWSDVA